jgi:hypothetical protein
VGVRNSISRAFWPHMSRATQKRNTTLENVAINNVVMETAPVVIAETKGDVEYVRYGTSVVCVSKVGACAKL